MDVSPTKFKQWAFAGVGETFDAGEPIVIRQNIFGGVFGKGSVFAFREE